MNAQLLGFGEIRIEGKRYDADVVIERGHVRRRRKKPAMKNFTRAAQLGSNGARSASVVVSTAPDRDAP
jgi:hypothetical protein